MTNLKFTRRQLIRNPDYSLIAILILSTGIGGTTAIYSAVDAVALNPAPSPNPDRQIQIVEQEHHFHD
ncbi:MAG: hypothetical protein M2R45_03231 [Verrucomicrobia subdivision 3 bacterium]|nr:hypothetical protein [Limisphaerales bacterium]MCS1416092.1 hypothetical protein [Limisphaerales bacterium]